MAFETSARELEVLIAGTGASEGLPDVAGLLQGKSSAACRAWQQGDARDRRRPTGGDVVRFYADGRQRNIVIDCPPSFSDSVRELWPFHGLRPIDAVLLTHAHDDATDGLGQLRAWTALSAIQATVDVYCTAKVEAELRASKPWVFHAKKATGSREIGDITFHTIKPGEPFEVHGLSVLAVPVEHGTYTDGSPYPCLAFLFDKTLFYASDQHAIPVTSIELIQKTVGDRLPLLLVASLRLQPHPSHFSFADACHLSRVLNASKTYLICLADGPSHEQWLSLCHRLHFLSFEQADEPMTWATFEPPKGVSSGRLLWHSVHTEAGVPSDDTEGFIEFAFAQTGALNGAGRWLEPAFDGLALRVKDGLVEPIERLTASVQR